MLSFLRTAVVFALSVFLLSAITPRDARAEQRIYWLDANTNTLNRAALDGSNIQPIITFTPGEAPNHIAIDEVNSKIYWTDAILPNIQRANLDGSNRQPLAATATGPEDLVVDGTNGYIFWISNNTVRRANLDGTGSTLFLSPQPSRVFEGLAVDPTLQTLLFADREGGNYALSKTIYISPVPESIGTVPNAGGIGARISPGLKQVVFTDNVSNFVARLQYQPINPAFTPLFPIPDGIDEMTSVAVTFNDTEIFFIDDIANGIFRRNLGVGSNLENIVPTARPLDIALDCGPFAPDGDGDGADDCREQCPIDPAKTDPGFCGCGFPETDGDGDGTPDCADACATDPAKKVPGVCGCNMADSDFDADGTPDCNDACSIDPLKTAVGQCGCGVADSDFDSDGTADCLDLCQFDPAKLLPGICGCGSGDSNVDGDLVVDCLELCPNDPAKTEPGACGCGAAEQSPCGGPGGSGTLRELSPGTKITVPPTVVVNGDDVTVVMEQFSGAVLKKKKQTAKGLVLEFEVAAAGKKAPKIKYELNLKPTGGVGKRDVKTAVSKRNEYTFKNLKPGTYAVKYRAQIVQGKTVKKTGFSPAASFKVS